MIQKKISKSTEQKSCPAFQEDNHDSNGNSCLDLNNGDKFLNFAHDPIKNVHLFLFLLCNNIHNLQIPLNFPKRQAIAVIMTIMSSWWVVQKNTAK